jgi:hypothetical protein
METTKSTIPVPKQIDTILKEIKDEGGTKIIEKIVKPRERRQPCGECGRGILYFYNPEGFCRKCKKIRTRRVIRMANRRARGTL